MGVSCFPAVPVRQGLAVGLDLPWSAARGFMDDDEGGAPAPAVARFLARHRDDFQALFVSVQPRRREVLDVVTAQEHAHAFVRAHAALSPQALFTLHHTRLDTAQPAELDSEDDRATQRDLFAYTEALVQLTGAAWVNEDLGIWTLEGKALPYPLPPLLTSSSLRKCIANVRAVQAALSVPFVVEFPGYSEGAGFTVGALCPLEFFRSVVEESASHCTLDTAHILGLCQQRGWHAREVIDALPLHAAIDIHMSGVVVRDDGSVLDAHHGVLHDAQFALLEALLPRCPALRVVTYEDPRFDDDGVLIPKAKDGFTRLCDIVRAWAAS